MSIATEKQNTNSTLALLAARSSTRKFAPCALDAATRSAILDGALAAPTAGAMMLYSIIDIQDQALKDRLSVLCDNQAFIAAAPLVLIFVADYRKWLDMFEASDCYALDLENSETQNREIKEAKEDALPQFKPESAQHRTTVGIGDFLLAAQDAVIAAQNAVIAAESLGVGSCYIGDIVENCEAVAELLELPSATLPLSMLIFGYPHKELHPTPHATRHMVMIDRYERATSAEVEEQIAERERLYPTRWNKPGIDNNVQALYARKFTSDFMAEMNRSAAGWLERWQS